MLRASLLLVMLLPTTAIGAGGQSSGPKVMVMRRGKLLPLPSKARLPGVKAKRRAQTLAPRRHLRGTSKARRSMRATRTVLTPRMRLAISRWPNNRRGRYLRQRQLSAAKREMDSALSGGTALEQHSTRALYQALLSEAR